MMNLGDFTISETIYVPLTTYDNAGGSVTLTGLAVTDIEIYKDGSTTQRSSDSGYTLLDTDGIDFDGITGLHAFSIDLSDDTDAGFFVDQSQYWLVVNSVTVDGQTVVVAYYFTIGRIATRSQLDQVANVSGVAKRAPESYVLTTGTQSANTVSSTEELDGTRHEHTDTAGEMELYYEFNVGSGSPTEIKMTGYLQGNNDDLEVHGFDWVSSTWKRIGMLEGQATANNSVNSYDLLVDMVGSGASEGIVRVRFQDGAFTLTSATLAIDQILVEFTLGAEGYEGGAVWLDTNVSNTNTVRGVDGIATNPVSTIAAVNTLLAATNLARVEVAPSSSFTFAATQANQKFVGENWALALGGQSISGSFIQGAEVSGIATGAAEIHWDHCHFGNVTLPPSDCEECVLEGTFTMGTAGEFFFENCKSGVAGTNTPVLDFGSALNSSNVNFRSYSGGIQIENMGAGTGSYNMSLEGHGQLLFGAGNSATSTIAIRGQFTKAATPAGVTISDDARYDVAQINAECDTALSDYDGPTNAEMEARTLLAGSYAPDIADAVLKEAVGDHTATSDSLAENINTIKNRLPTALVGGAIQADLISINGIGQAADDLQLITELSRGVTINATGGTGGKDADDLVDDVWDEDVEADHQTPDSAGERIRNIHSRIGTPVALDGGGANIADNLKKLADDNSGADFIAASDSLNVIGTKVGTTSAALGIPANIDGGGATIADNLKKIADDNDGADFDATTDSLAVHAANVPTFILGTATALAASQDVTNEVEVFQNSDRPVLAFTVVDAAGAAVDLSAADLQFDVSDPITKAVVFTLATGGSGITVGGDSNNVVSVTYTATNTATVASYDYRLWVTTGSDADQVLSAGSFEIVPAVKS